MKERMEGLITAVHRERYEVQVKNETYYARLKKGIYYADRPRENFPIIGDEVELEYNAMGDSQIVRTKSRKSKFSRKDPDAGRGEQMLAANFDYVFIMMSLNFDFNVRRLERYITTAWQSGAQPVILLTKADIAEQAEEKLEQVRQIAEGIEVLAISAVTGDGMDSLQKYLQPGITIVFLGSSGVGKSTLTNHLLGKEVMDTGEIRETDSKGHHTTTHRQMFVLENGARIIDTPGMRELGMWDVEEGMDASFADVVNLALQCRFSNCSHTNEPHCAVQKALENGTLAEARWKNYIKIQRESEFQRQKELRKKKEPRR